ncbi:hypothetical protein EVAR_40961_1 [Eumeta japonica]|uniref:Uncharacterized protein n=1 Tax=Eumeta variegata TaxID=151549 RepID=A0A4C1X3U9_EUMVA|nr:hypothetical protein EVAR_40961_1 [Eumeta japonica]
MFVYSTRTAADGASVASDLHLRARTTAYGVGAPPGPKSIYYEYVTILTENQKTPRGPRQRSALRRARGLLGGDIASTDLRVQ